MQKKRSFPWGKKTCTDCIQSCTVHEFYPTRFTYFTTENNLPVKLDNMTNEPDGAVVTERSKTFKNQQKKTKKHLRRKMFRNTYRQLKWCRKSSDAAREELNGCLSIICWERLFSKSIWISSWIDFKYLLSSTSFKQTVLCMSIQCSARWSGQF